MKLTIVQRMAILLSYLAAAGSAAAAVTVEEPWVRATVPGQSVAAAYMRVRSTEPATLVEVRTPVAARAEIHEMSMQDGVMKMRRIARLPLRSDRAVELKPGGHHLMLTDVTRPLKDGDKVPLTLVVERQDKKREELRVDAEVRSAAAKPAHEHHH